VSVNECLRHGTFTGLSNVMKGGIKNGLNMKIGEWKWFNDKKSRK